MASRPNFIDLRSTSSTSVNSIGSRPLRSPRLHVAGDVPPTLSPLDAFAAQSRMLAKQLEESQRAGRRVSRLPPLTTESPLVLQGRSDYFRSMSYDASEGQEEASLDNTGFALTRELEEPTERPMSMHPRMSRIPPTPEQAIPMPSLPFEDRGRSLGPLEGSESKGYYGARREQSPSDFDNATESSIERISMDQDAVARAPFLEDTRAMNSLPPSPQKLTRQISHDSVNLAPPRSIFPKRSSSIMSQPVEFSNDEMMSASFHSQPAHRKLSSASGYSSLASPAIPTYPYQQRSPSISSVASLPRPSFNFSRPLSRAGTPSFDTPQRQASSDSQPSFVLADDTAHTPISMHSEVYTDNSGDERKGAPSYIYSKYSLPRGKALQRGSLLFNPDDVAQISWEQPMVPPSNVQPYTKDSAPPSPPSRPTSSSSRSLDGPPVLADTFLARPSLERSKLSYEVSINGESSPQAPNRPSTAVESRPSEDAPRGRTLGSTSLDQSRRQTLTSVATSDSASTIKPTKSIAPSAAEAQAEEHLAKGIKCHEDGSLKESTYHLRLAAKGGSPTGMLLYALACRHGWGMRPNQKEGVEWLRKAVDSASVEIAEDEGQAKTGKMMDPTERKTRKAQFALSIYELGVSHMNGWGIEQDKALGLRCFEIAGNWGDVDALTEAGFCYAQGVGTKKDLKKSARFYRLAEAKGMSMPGNSWIHKSKYADDAASVKSKRGRSKSRSRGIFSRKPKETKEAQDRVSLE